MLYIIKILCAALCLCLAWLNPASAHAPHDVVADLQLSPDFAHDKTMFCSVYWRLFKSTDGGYSWNHQSRGLCTDGTSVIALSPAFAEDRTLFSACAHGHIHRSCDGGLSWELLHTRQSMEEYQDVFLAVSPRFKDDLTVLALYVEGDIFRSHDAGKSWHKILHSDVPVASVDWAGSEIVFGTSQGELCRSGDGGLTWVKTGRLPVPQKVTCIKLPDDHAAGGPFFIGTEKEGIFKVTDGGAAFHRISTGIPEASYITSLDLLDDGRRRILLASSWTDALYRSEDEGRSWEKHAAGLLKHSQADEYLWPYFNKIAVSSDGKMFLGSFCGIFMSEDAGETWTKIETLYRCIIGLGISPMTGDGYTVSVNSYGHGMYTYAGSSWEINSRRLPTPRLGPIAYSPAYARDRTVFTATYGFVLRSDSEHGSWRWASVYPPRMSLQYLHTRLKDKIRHYVFTYRLTSVLKLLNWLDIDYQDAPLIPLCLAVSPNFEDDHTVFAGLTPQGLIRSTDGGTTFSTVWSSEGSSVAALALSPDFHRDATVFASLGTGGLYRSTDRGLNWQSVGGRVVTGRVAIVVSPAYDSDRTLYAGGQQGLFRSRDGGDSWMKIPLPETNAEAAVSQLAVSPCYVTDRQILVQIKNGELLLCSDSGSGFRVLSSPCADSPYEFTQTLGRDVASLMGFSPDYARDRTIYGASMDKLIASSDNGKTWQELVLPMRYEAEAAAGGDHVVPLVLEGQWKKNIDRRVSGSGLLSTDTPGSTVTLRFLGSGFDWLGVRGPDRGIALLAIDGQAPEKIDLYGEGAYNGSTVIRSVSGLAQGPHVLTITCDGGRTMKSSGSRIDIDAIDIRR